MALDFPTSPAVNDTVTIDNKTWRYNGKGWKLVPNQIQGLQGTQGLSVQGQAGSAQGSQGSQGLSNQGVQGLSNQGVQGLQGTQGTFGPATVPLSTDTFGSGDTIADVFTTGQNCVIYNDTASQQTLTAAAGITLRLAGTGQTGTRYLQQRGLATVICVGISSYAISGAGVT